MSNNDPFDQTDMDDEQDDNEPGRISQLAGVVKDHATVIIPAFILLAGFVTVFFPPLQTLGYILAFANPSIIQWAVIGTAIGGYALISEPELPRLSQSQTESLLLGIAVVVLFGGIMFGPFVGGVYANIDMADQVEGDAGATELETLPNTSTENVRVIPRSVSDSYAQSSVQFPQYRLTESDITYRDGSYRFSYGIAPDNLVVKYTGNQRGAMYVNMTQTEKDIAITNTTFKFGRGQGITDSYMYRSTLNEPLKLHKADTIFNAESPDGEPYIAHSLVQHNIKFRLLPIPQLYSVPEFAGVQIAYPDGEIQTLSPEEAQSSELLRGQNYYPYDLTMFKVRSTQYANGALNKWFVKDGVLSVTELPEGGNGWPLTVPTGDSTPELTYFVATEPTGSGSGVFEVWTIDSQTGEMGVKSYDDAQIGPRKAVDFVERQPDVNRLSAEAVAPVSIVKDGHLYWHTKVTPESSSGVVYTAFVAADTGDVTLVRGTSDTYRFLSETEAAAIDTGGQNTSDSGATQSGSTVTVVVTDETGEITGTRNITVPEGGDIQIDIPN